MAHIFLSEGQRQSLEPRTTTPAHVGPGYYETTTKTKHKRSSSAPFLTKQVRDLTPITNTRATTPGPGAYPSPATSLSPSHLSSKEKGKSGSAFASTTNRFDDDTRGIPGPGSYTPVEPTPVHHPPQKQTTAADSVFFQKYVTPPSVPTSNYGYDVDAEGNLQPHKPSQKNHENSHSPKEKAKGPDFRRAPIRRSVFEEAQKDSVVPGPGDYNISKKTHHGTAAFSASRAPRFQPSQSDYVPGPTDYDPNLQIGKKPVVQKYQHPTLKIYESEPPPPKPTVIRGSTIKKKKNPSSSSSSSSPFRPNSLPPNSSPGPGDYVIDVPRRERKSKSVTISQTARFKEDKNETNGALGPGYYDLPTLSNNSLQRFSRTNDRFAKSPVDTPGVGDYDIDKDALSYIPPQPSSMFASTTGRTSPTKEDLSPMYNVHKELDNKKSISFPQANRFDYSNEPLQVTPGPGSYNSLSPQSRTKNRSPSPFGFNGRRFQEEERLSPGPGDYDTSEAYQKKSFNKYLQ